MTFLLPGEAQKIDRIMEAFAQRYYECNPDLYASAGRSRLPGDQRRTVQVLVEVCYIVSFALIMLNTSLHNKSARLAGGPFTYEKFTQSLNEAIPRHQIPETATIKVNTRLRLLLSMDSISSAEYLR